MSEMIKRVARALCIADGHDPDGPTCDIFVEGDPDAVYPWAGYRMQARAAIEAMREPTREMLEAVNAGSRDRFGGETEEMYTNMIEAALGEKGEE